MQQVRWKNREQFFREQCEKISQIVNSNVYLKFYREKLVELFIKSKKHKLAIINKLLVVNFLRKICCLNLFGSN